MKDVKLNNNIKCCSSEQVEFGNTARDIILYKKIKELAIVVENKQDKFDFVKLINPSGNLGRDIVGKLFTNKLIELEYNDCFYSFSKADESTLVYQALTADLNLLKIVTINIATGDYLVIEQSNEVLDDHIADQVIHVSQADRDRWNNINDGILTIQTNGTNVQTFSANQSNNVTANIIVPTKTSDLTNDSNFVISSDLAVFATKEYVNGSVASAISRVYKPQGTVTVNTLNSLTITKEMNGYVYDILGSGTLTKGSVQVAQGDNVAIIWNEDETDWKWDRLSSIVDLSNYATKTYVDNNSGKINSISLNGTALTINSNKNVDIPVSLTTTAGSEAITVNSNSLNVVTRDTDQTITGIKTNINKIQYKNSANSSYTFSFVADSDYVSSWKRGTANILRYSSNEGLTSYYNFIPAVANTYDLGSSTSKWKDLYLNGKVDFGTKIEGRTNTSYITTDNYDGVGIYVNGIRPINIYDNAIYLAKPLLPNTTTIDIGGTDKKFRDLYLSGNVILSSPNANYKLLADGAWFDIKRDNTTVFQFYDTIIKSPKDNYADLGVSGNRWKNLYLAGNISDGTNSVSVADISNGTFNVINASDIVNNTLTQEQYNLITNGKPTLIKGEFGNYKDLLFVSGVVYDNSFRGIGICTAKAGGFGQNLLLKILINETTKAVSFGSKYTTFNYDGGLGVVGLDTVNGKAIPAYPSSTGTFNLKQIDGTLTWTKEWYGTQAEYDALGTYDNNTIYNIIEE